MSIESRRSLLFGHNAVRTRGVHEEHETVATRSWPARTARSEIRRIEAGTERAVTDPPIFDRRWPVDKRGVELVAGNLGADPNAA